MSRRDIEEARIQLATAKVARDEGKPALSYIEMGNLSATIALAEALLDIQHGLLRIEGVMKTRR